MKSMHAIQTIILLTLKDTTAFPQYKPLFPNGERTIGGAVAFGHMDNQSGGGPRNQFGKDFVASGYKWTVELCKIDSDMDGYSNGKEMGDPNCVWKQGEVPEITDNNMLSNPGVADVVPDMEPTDVASQDGINQAFNDSEDKGIAHNRVPLQHTKPMYENNTNASHSPTVSNYC